MQKRGRLKCTESHPQKVAGWTGGKRRQKARPKLWTETGYGLLKTEKEDENMTID